MLTQLKLHIFSLNHPSMKVLLCIWTTRLHKPVLRLAGNVTPQNIRTEYVKEILLDVNEWKQMICG